jgi:hypothetical protein
MGALPVCDLAGAVDINGSGCTGRRGIPIVESASALPDKNFLLLRFSGVFDIQDFLQELGTVHNSSDVKISSTS